MTTPQPWSPPMTSTAIRITKRAQRAGPALLTSIGSGSDGDHLASLVITAGRADPVGHIGCRALRAGAELRQRQHAVVSAAHALAALRRFSLWNAHKFRFLLKFQFIQLCPGRRFLSRLAGIAGCFWPCHCRCWQAATLRLTQRMLRKLEENIFPHIGRQVHAIVGDRPPYPRLPAANGASNRSSSSRVERFQTANTLAFQASNTTVPAPAGCSRASGLRDR